MTPISSINFSLTEHFGITRVPPTKITPSPPLFFLCMKIYIFRFFRNTEGFPYELFQQCETKKTQTEKRETFPHSHILILPTRAFLEHKGPPCGSFGTVRQKNPTKLWCPPPPTPMHETFHHHVFFERQKGSPYEHFQHCETKLFRPEKRDTPLFIHKFFPYQNNSESQGSPLRNFWLMWDEKKVEKAVMPPLPLLCVKFLNTRTFWNTEGSPTTLLGTVRQKLSTEKHDTLPLIKSFFSLPECFWNTRVSPLTTFFGNVRQKLSDGKTWYTLQIHKFLSYPIFSESQGSPLRNFLVSCDKENDTTVLPPFLSQSYAWNFWISEFFKTQKRYPTNFFSTVRQKNSDGKTLSMKLSMKLSRTFLKHKCTPAKTFDTVDKKLSTEKQYTFPL